MEEILKAQMERTKLRPGTNRIVPGKNRLVPVRTKAQQKLLDLILGKNTVTQPS